MVLAELGSAIIGVVVALGCILFPRTMTAVGVWFLVIYVFGGGL